MNQISEKRNKLTKCRILFWGFFKIAALVVGGGYAIVPAAENEFIHRKKLLTEEELLDMMAIIQSLPGIIAGNAAAFVGMKVAGYPGVIAAVIGVILPSVTVITLIAAFFPGLKAENPYVLGAFAGVKACITGLIIVTAIKLFAKTVKGAYEGIAFALYLILLLFFKVNAAYVIILSIPVGFVYSSFLLCRIKKNKGEGVEK